MQQICTASKASSEKDHNFFPHTGLRSVDNLQPVAKRPKSETRAEDRLASGWTRQGIQLPMDIGKFFRAVAADQGSVAGIKTLGTAAIALILGMPKEQRDAICRYVAQANWGDPNQLITPEKIWEIFRESFGLREGEDGEWYIDRILDPEVTPPPGQKASDKERRDLDAG